MSIETIPTLEETAASNLKRLFLLRNIELIGIGLGIGIAITIFKLELPLKPLLLILGLITALNIATWFRLKTGRRVHDKEIFFQIPGPQK